jgi:endonuclease-3
VSALAAILDELEAHYGEVASPAPEDPYELVVFLNSGYPASDERCAKGYTALGAAIGIEPDAILGANEVALAEVLEAGGMIPELRAQRLRQIATFVRDRCAGDLRAALLADPVRATALLKGFPTFGEPAAERILLFCDLAPEPAAPAGVLQVMTRLGLSEEGKAFTATYRAARTAIAAGIPEDFAARRRAYLLLKTHGHGLCKRSSPRCEACPVRSACPFALSAAA